MHSPDITFIGGGNMASAIIAGLIQSGTPAGRIRVIEPLAAAREAMASRGVVTLAQFPVESLEGLVVWAVKPQVMREAALAAAPWTRQALHLSVAAGIRSDSLCAWLGTDRVVRAMPNTPALVGQGITALLAGPGVSDADRAQVEATLNPTGEWLWVSQESHLDAVTALSGSGPAYVFYFLEAMRDAGQALGLDADQAYRLGVATFRGAAALAAASSETPQVLRERVTSKGGTTYAALTSLEASGVKNAFIEAMQAAALRAHELGEEFGKA